MVNTGALLRILACAGLLCLVSANNTDVRKTTRSRCRGYNFHSCDDEGLRCYHNFRKCDGVRHCPNGADEENCSSIATVVTASMTILAVLVAICCVICCWRKAKVRYNEHLQLPGRQIDRRAVSSFPAPPPYHSTTTADHSDVILDVRTLNQDLPPPPSYNEAVNSGFVPEYPGGGGALPDYEASGNHNVSK